MVFTEPFKLWICMNEVGVASAKLPIKAFITYTCTCNIKKARYMYSIYINFVLFAHHGLWHP